MPGKNNGELQQRRDRAEDWRFFRANNLLTQRRMAAILGISRRTIQQIEGAYITPHPETLRRFSIFKQKYDAHADIS